MARALGVPIVTVPTIASNDGPASRVIAMYDDEHRLVDTPHLLANPELVVVDIEVIAAAPTRFLQSGIADALETWRAGVSRRRPRATAIENSGGARIVTVSGPDRVVDTATCELW